MKRIVLMSAVAAVMLSACASSDNAKEEKPAFASDAAKADPKITAGAGIYQRTCITCHQANGEGIANMYPPLAKSDYLGDKTKVIEQVLKGSSGEMIVNGQKYNSTMPPQALNDEEVAQVLTYVYGAFGNGGTVSVTVDEVKAVRGK